MTAFHFHFQHACLATLALLLQWPLPAAASDAPPTANVIMGGAERRCSSFTGRAQSAQCTADWDTILKLDPAFEGLAPHSILFESDYPEPAWTYSVTLGGLQALRASPDRLMAATHKAGVLDRLSTLLATRSALQGQSWGALQAQLNSAPDGGTLQLSPAEWSVVRNALVEAQDLPPRKVQLRSTLFSSNVASVALLREFVSAARARNAGATPLIGVVTASGGPHPFVDHDINTFALQSAGARVVFLPLDGGMRMALDQADCANLHYYYDSYANANAERPVAHGHLLFPDLARQQTALCAQNGQLLNETLRTIHGIYFSGGNQARHLESLVVQDPEGNYTRKSAQWLILQQRHALGQLVVAGTSAGNHIQGGGWWRDKPVPMIGGGDAYEVLKTGYARGLGPGAEPSVDGLAPDNARYPPVIYPLGGLGVFRFGVLDSHFSKRTREARLIRATLDSGMDYGFGVDENTALLVSQTDTAGSTHFSVIGAGGVFIADVRGAPHSHWRSTPAFVVQEVLAHYLLPGDTARIDANGQLAVALSPTRPVLGLQSKALQTTQTRVLDYGSGHFLRLATRMGLAGTLLGFGSTVDSQDTRTRQQDPQYRTLLQRGPATVFRGTPAQDGTPPQLAYTHLRVGFEPCNGPCQDVDNPEPP